MCTKMMHRKYTFLARLLKLDIMFENQIMHDEARDN